MAGAPVITSRMASLPELGGECVEYVDTPSPENLCKAMNKVMTLSPKQRRERLIKARERSRSFTWERTGELTLRVLLDIANK